MFYVKSYYFLLVTYSASLTLRAEKGFELFFQTNLEEMNNVPIVFDKPLPVWLKGTLIRNGLGQFEMGKRKFLHTFDGFGKLTSWTFHGNSSATFSTRMIQSDFYQDSLETDDIAPYLMFEGVDPPFNEMQKLVSLSRGIDNMNVNVYSFYDESQNKSDYIVLNDFWKVYKIDPYDLSTKGPYTADIPQNKHFKGKFAFLNFLSSAHPLLEHGTTNHFTFLTSVSLVPWIKSTISLIRINSLQKRQLVAQWNVDQVPYMHSFSVTSHYVVMFASPFYVNTLKMIKTAEPFESLDWHPDEKTKVYVINTNTGKVNVFETDTMFTMHHVNAFETEEGEIVVDVSSYPNPDFVSSLKLENLLDPVRRNEFDAHALLKRYIINVEKELLSLHHFQISKTYPFTVALDMPVINERYRYRNYCNVYGIVLKSDNILLSSIALVKKNICGKPDLDESWIVKGHYPVEPVFVASPDQKAEDDGILLVPVIDGNKAMSYLAVLDARNMELISKAYLPTLVPYNLHGRFFPEVV